MRMPAARPFDHLPGHALARLLAGLLLALVLSGCAGVKYTDQPTSHVDLAAPGAPLEAATRVLAKSADWRDAGVTLRAGVSYRIQATAKWRVGGFCNWSDADGLGIYTPLCLNLGGMHLGGWSHGALIGRVGEGGQPFGIGKSYTFTPRESGTLYLRINDGAALMWDNQGHADVAVSLAEAPGLAAAPPLPDAMQAEAKLAEVKAAEAKQVARKKAVGSAEAQTLAVPAPAPAPAVEAAPIPAQAVLPSLSQPPAAQAAQIPGGRSGLRRVALVIGNGSYPTAPLRNPVNDARDMAASLRSLGFEVILRENASLRQMEDAVDELWNRLKGGGAGLFFFAGHGLQVGGRNFLVPVDARLSAEQDVKYRCMDAGLVLGRMENAGNQLNIVILDACRNNPYSRSFRSASEGLAKMDAPKGSLVAYATAPDSVAADGSGKNGIYTGLLLKHLRTPGLGIEELFKRVRIDVLAATGEKQVPWESSSLTGYFTFNESGR